MQRKETRGVPGRLEGIRRRFQHWRRTRKIRSRIPDRLWASAVKMAGTYGIHRTAKVLQVDYYALKKRVEQGTPATAGVPAASAMAAFVELAPSPAAGSCECILELEDAEGAKMRVYLKGFQTPDLPALSRSFWSPTP